jgi:hypothetical protein
MKAEHDQPGIDEQADHFGGAADVFHPVGIGKAQVFVEPQVQVVAIEEVGALPLRIECPFHRVGNRRLPRPGKPCEPDDQRREGECISSETFGTPLNQEERHASATHRLPHPGVLPGSGFGVSLGDDAQRCPTTF